MGFVDAAGWGCSSVGSASDRHAADAGSILWCGKGFFSQSQRSVQTFRTLPMCNRMHLHLCTRQRSCSPCQSSVDYGNTKTPSMHRRLGSATLSQLAFPEFPMGEIPLVQNSCKKPHTIVTRTNKAKLEVWKPAEGVPNFMWKLPP